MARKTRSLVPQVAAPAMSDWSQRIMGRKCPKPSCGGSVTIQYDLDGAYISCTNGHTLVQSLDPKLVQYGLNDDRSKGNMASYVKKP